MLKLNYKENQCLCFCEATDVIDIPFTITYPIGTGLLDFLAYNEDRFSSNLWDFIAYLFKTKSKNIKDDCRQDFFDYFAINGANIYLNVYARTIITTINALLNRKPKVIGDKVKNIWEEDFFYYANDKLKSMYKTLPDEIQRQIIPYFIEVIAYINEVVGEIKDYKNMITSELNILYKIIENKGYETLTSEQILFAMDYHRPYETKKTEIFYQNTIFNTTMMMYLEDKNFEAFTTSIHENIEDAIKITKEKKVSLIEMYNIGNLYDLAILDMIKIIQNKCLIKKCGHCGFYFTPEGRIDAIYCNREIYPTKKLCSDVGSIIKHKQKAASDEGLAYFQLIYKRNSSRVGNRKISSKTFREWSKIARETREKYKDGEINIDEFKKILGE